MAQTLRFYQLADGYAYNSDSLLLLDFAKQFVKGTSKNVLDMGAGCGILGIMCAYHFAAKVVAIEHQAKVALLAAINTKTAPLATRPIATHKGSCHILCANFLDTSTPKLALDLLATINQPHHQSHTFYDQPQPLTAKKPKFDLLIANPPFYRSGSLQSTNAFLHQARYESQLPIQAWIHQSKKLLTPRGALVFCFQASEVARVLEVLNSNGFKCEVLRFVYPLYSRQAKIALFYARLDSKAQLLIEPPLFTHNSNRQHDFTQEVAQIYATYSTHSIKIHAQDIIDSVLMDQCHEVLTIAPSGIIDSS